MKAVINGKRYDTETAKLICESSFENPSNFNYYDEGLYITKNGAYFLAGKGGANSKYRTTVAQNSWSGGSAIIPMDKKQAFEYCQQVDTTACEEYFSDIIEDA
jgi:hypothetical protein